MYYREIGTKSGYKISAKRRSLIVRCCLLFGLCQTRHALALCLRTTQIEGVQLLGGAGFALAEQGECGGGNTKSGRKPQLGGCELQTGAVLFDSIITQIRAISNQKIRRFSDFFGKLGQLDRTVIAQTAYAAVLYGEKCVVNLTRTRIHHAAQVAAECAGAPCHCLERGERRGTACLRRAPDP